MKICITGDLFLGGDVLKYKQSDSLINSKSYDQADYRISNFEQAISENDQSANNKCVLFSSKESLLIAKKLKTDAFVLSNNHIQDMNEDGIIDTIQLINEAGIRSFGAGKNYEDARKPFWLNEKYCIIGYCQFHKKYLKKVQPATQEKAGINLLLYEKIIEDLSKLPENVKAILHFHWGREHIAFPDHENIELAKRLLENDKVLFIVGMHSHRIQGTISYNGKKAFMSLGNFLFPNFYLKPPTCIYYPDEVITSCIMTTKDYHFVGKSTYKIWRLKNRLSLMIVYDSDDNTFQMIPLLQMKKRPFVTELKGIRKRIVLFIFHFISLLYKTPKPIYLLFFIFNLIIHKITRYSYILFFLIRQNGFLWSMKKFRDRI